VCSQSAKRTEQVMRILSAFTSKLEREGRDLSFELELKGLGSWVTKSENIILYADFSKESQQQIKSLAKEMRDYLKSCIDKEEAENPFTDPLDIEVEQKILDPAKPNSPSSNSSEDQSSSNESSESASESDDSEKAPGSDSQSSEDDTYLGLWFDDPRPDCYMPHVTILNSDPRNDKKLRKMMIEKKATTQRKGDKRNKRGGVGKGGREKGVYEQKVVKQQQEKEPFGWNYSLLRDTRSEFSKITFGKQDVKYVELQRGYKCLSQIYLSPKDVLVVGQPILGVQVV